MFRNRTRDFRVCHHRGANDITVCRLLVVFVQTDDWSFSGTLTAVVTQYKPICQRPPYMRLDIFDGACGVGVSSQAMM